VLQYKWLHIATFVLWYNGNGQIHEDVGFPFFVDHIRGLTRKFRLRVSWCGKSLSSAIRQIPALTRIDPDSLQSKLRVNEYVKEGSNRKNISIKPEILI